MTHHTVEGAVEMTNQRGIRILGEWYNVSQFHPVNLPNNGTYVRLEVDGKGFIRDISMVPDETLDDAGPSEADLRDDRRVRLGVLEAAVRFAASRPDMKSNDVLLLADKWLAWVEQD